MGRETVIRRLAPEPSDRGGGMPRRGFGDEHSAAIHFPLDRDRPGPAGVIGRHTGGRSDRC